jgi:hypothetical protein
MRNKANSPPGRPGGRSIVQNKANFGQPSWRPGVDCAKRSQLAGGNRAKRTQFRPSAREWALAAGAPEGKLCKTKPISGQPGGWERPIVRNKANLAGRPGPRRANCAKRSQFPAGRDTPTIPIFHYSSIPVRCRLCKTKPIPAGPGGMGPRERGAIVQNEPNFGERTGRGREPVVQTKPICPTRTEIGTGRRSHQRRGRLGTLRQTNPICDRRAGKTIAKARGLDDATRQAASAPNKANLARRRVWTRAGKAVGTAADGTHRAKQSQFANTGGDGRGPASLPVPRAVPIVRNKANFRSVGETECLFLLYSASGRW